MSTTSEKWETLFTFPIASHVFLFLVNTSQKCVIHWSRGCHPAFQQIPNLTFLQWMVKCCLLFFKCSTWKPFIFIFKLTFNFRGNKWGEYQLKLLRSASSLTFWNGCAVQERSIFSWILILDSITKRMNIRGRQITLLTSSERFEIFFGPAAYQVQSPQRCST